MKLTVSKFSNELSQISAQYDAKEAGLDTEEYRFIEPIQVSASVIKEANTLIISLDLKSKIAVACARCIEDSTLDYASRFDLEIDIADQTTVDIAEDIRQEIILTYPTRFICKEGCLGLCQVCGRNLNEGPCGCKK